MEEILANDTGQPIERIHQDTLRDNFMSADTPGLRARGRSGVVSLRDLNGARRQGLRLGLAAGRG
jgi:hypothetical protein